MTRAVKVPRTLTIRGEEVDCIVHVDAAVHENVEVLKVTVDAKDGATIPTADWPANLAELVAEDALRIAGDQVLDGLEDSQLSQAED